jgi:TonB family protein
MAGAWKDLEGQVVDGEFPLRQYLGCGEHSGVFLTEFESRKAAIKLAPEFPADLAGARPSHPHLLPLFRSGHCRLGESDLAYVVMEYADENLSQVLPERALAPDEVHALLPPALDALRYLHANGLVHGRLKPANILAVNDRLKISSDGLRRADAASSLQQDVWLLGATLVEALTQQAPAGDPVVPTSLPQPFLDIVRGCLDRDPDRRWSLADIAARLEPSPPRPKWRYLAPVLGLAIGGIVIGSRLLERRPGTPPVPAPAVERAPVVPAPAAEPPKVQSRKKPPAERAEAIHKVLPEVPAKAQSTITGRVRIRIRLSVDAGGKVTDAKLDSPGASPYFAGLSLKAARQWKFAPNAAKDVIVRFEYTRAGVKAAP